MKRTIIKLVSGLAAVTISATLAVVVGAPEAFAYERRACDPEGPTSQDLAIGQQLNTQLTKDMRGHMGSYETSCARVITETVKARGLSSRAAVIAVTTAIVETHLQNLNGGDLDSIGLYQQRSGWGSAAQRIDAVWSTNRFLNEMLTLYPNNSWTSGDIGDICQSIQRSAYPDRYGVQVSDAQIIVNTLWNLAGSSSMPGLSAVSRGVGGLDVFAVTTDGRLKHRNYSSGTWSCWSTLYGNATIKGEPAAITSSGRIDVFAQGIDNRLKKITWTSTHGWYQWADMGDYTITSPPAVTSRSPTGIDVFVKNTANKIVYRHFDIAQSAWTNNWSNIGGNASTTTATSGPAAVANHDGTRMNVFARATDGSLLSLMWTLDHGWYNWADRGGSLNGRPSASTRSGNSVDIFLRDQDNSLIHWYSPDGADWTTYPKSDFGGWLAVSPTAVSWNSGRIDVFSRNSNADLIQKTWISGDPWYAWTGRGPVGAPAC
ncbi:hypothetical protein AB0H63_31770 [Micromonospora echinospora]|uniref:hypothetical protein n=1 Tax=Micromonospora echinospora TaxID=1877 RepID=UPI003409735C